MDLNLELGGDLSLISIVAKLQRNSKLTYYVNLARYIADSVENIDKLAGRISSARLWV